MFTIKVQKIKSKIELQRCEFCDLNLYFLTILTAVLLLKRRFPNIAKSPILRTGGNNNSKSWYENDLNFLGHLDRCEESSVGPHSFLLHNLACAHYHRLNVVVSCGCVTGSTKLML